MRATTLVSYVCASAMVLGCGSDEADDRTEITDLVGADGAVLGDASLPGDPGQTGTPGQGGTNTSADAGGSAADASTADDTGTMAPPVSAGCLDGITDYKTKGKFSFATETSGQVKMWVPKVPAGCKVPVVHLANGTGATCSAYAAVLQHLASHGFYAVCFENTNTGQGTQCITAIETAIEKHPELADAKIGSTGHSQGGGAAFMCVQRAEEKWGSSKLIAGHSMEPASGYGDSPRDWATSYAKIKSPMFMFNGSADTLVRASWVQQAFDALDDATEAYWFEATGAAHIPVPTRWTQESAVAWFRWKLLGDKQACEYFKKLPMSNDWESKKTQAEKGC